MKLSKKALALLPGLLSRPLTDLYQMARAAGIPADGFDRDGLAALLADSFARRGQSPASAPGKPAVRRYKDQDFYHGEALHSTSRGGLVRFLRWRDDGRADVADMALGALPDALPAEDLIRPSTMPDAQWLRDVSLPVTERGKIS